VKKEYKESTLGLGTFRDRQVEKFFDRLYETYGSSIGSDVTPFFKTEQGVETFLESINNILDEEEFSGTGLTSSIMREDAAARSVGVRCIAKELLEESAQQGLATLRPISLTSFGFQIRSYTKAVMHRAVKTLQAEKPAFKITERKQFLIDINGNKRYFVDAFNHGSNLNDNIHKKFDVTVNVPSTGVDMFASNSIDPRNKMAVDIALKSYTAKESNGTDDATNLKIVGPRREIDLETGRFSINVEFGTDNAKGVIHGEFDFNKNQLVAITTTSSRIKTATFAMRLSSETHLSSLQVGIEHINTTVNIPDGAHIEVQLSQEFTDDASRMLGLNMLEEYTNQMGIAIERLEDISIFEKIKSLDSSAIVTDTFDVTPDAGFAYGKEEWIKRQFHPAVEQMCIRMKSELQIDDCHFRVIGNPIDIRLPNAAGEEYIFRRNQEMSGSVRVEYDFAVVTSGNTIFYLSSDRVPPGKIRILLIPNTIENNIITVNHYRYANYVSNKYRSSSNPSLPTVMVSSRYKTQEYLPIVGVLTVTGNKASWYTDLYQ